MFCACPALSQKPRSDVKLDEVGSAPVANADAVLMFKPPAAMLGSFTMRLPLILAGAR